MKKKILLCSVMLASLSLTACEEPGQRWDPQADAAAPSVNEGYINGSMAIPEGDAPTLGDVRNIHRTSHREISKKQLAENERIRDAAQAYGLQSGLAYANHRIDLRLNQRADELSKIYDFRPLLIKSPDGRLLLPPIITERDDTWDLSDNGKKLQVADKTYTIESDVQFVDNSPLWHTYLYRSYDKPDLPDEKSLPSDEAEQDIWVRYSTEGYNKGVRQAIDVFHEDIRKLNRDYNGMRRYTQLLAEGRISAPYVAITDLGTTGSDTRVNINHKVITVSEMPKLNYDRPEKVEGNVSTETPTEAAKTPPFNPKDAMDKALQDADRDTQPLK